MVFQHMEPYIIAQSIALIEKKRMEEFDFPSNKNESMSRYCGIDFTFTIDIKDIETTVWQGDVTKSLSVNQIINQFR